VPTDNGLLSGVRGLLKSDIQPGERTLRWFEPCEALRPFVQRFWSAEWSIPAGERRMQGLLPHPSANIVIAGGGATVIGVMTRSAIQPLEGSGMALGAKLRPGALRAFDVKEPRLLRDKAVPISAVFGGEALKIASSNAADATRELEAYLQERRPIHDTVSVKAPEIVEAAEQNSDILSVARLSALLGLTQRTMQEALPSRVGSPSKMAHPPLPPPTGCGQTRKGCASQAFSLGARSRLF
jgi:hypothetical protein